jgi:hypothetical protein
VDKVTALYARRIPVNNGGKVTPLVNQGYVLVYINGNGKKIGSNF